MKILICSIGSRGDIQPFLVLGEYLSQHGHEVHFASANIYREMAIPYHLTYHSFDGDYASIVSDEKMKELVGKNPFTVRKNLKEKVYPIIQNSIQKFYDLSDWADVIIYHPKSLVDCFGSEIQHKLIKAYVIPAFTSTMEFKNPILEFLPLPKFLNKFSYTLVKTLMNTVKTPIKNFRKLNGLPKKPLYLETPIIYGISPSLLPRPKDYPVDHKFLGFWLKKSKGKLNDRIINFLSKNRESLIITFGSMPYKSKININTFIKEILNHFNLDILVVRAWGLKHAEIEENENVLAIDQAPFDLLFPRANYVMHHGGAGTTATAIRAGIPQFICPILHPFGDQLFWGKLIEKNRIGVKPIPLSKLNSKKLINAINILRKKELKVNCSNLSIKVKQEDGLSNALRFIEACKK